MKKNLFLCLFALLGFLSAAAQTTGNKGFKLNVNSGDAYLDCGDITQLNKAGAYTIESWVNITLDDLDDRFIIFKKEQPDERNRIKVQVEKSGQIYVMQANGADGAYAQTSAGCYPKSGWSTTEPKQVPMRESSFSISTASARLSPMHSLNRPPVISMLLSYWAVLLLPVMTRSEYGIKPWIWKRSLNGKVIKCSILTRKKLI